MNGRERTETNAVGVSRRRFLAAGTTAGVLGLAGCVGATGGGDGGASPQGKSNGTGGVRSTGGGGTSTDATAAWRTAELADVRTGETFSVAGLDGPVLLEFFAVWCPVCTDQQRRIATLHEQRDDFTSVSLNTDPNEDAARVREHLERNGFDWRYAVAQPEVTRSLRDTFGSVVLTPPRAPVVRLCADGGATLLETGVKSADTLSARLDSC